MNVPNATQNVSKFGTPLLFGSHRPKIWLRRCKDRTARLAIEEYDLNRGTQAEAGALKNLRRVLGED